MYVIDRILKRDIGKHRRFSDLLWSLIILLFAYPVVSYFGVARFWSLLFTAELLFAVHSVSEGTRSLKIAAALVTPAVLGELSFFFFETNETHWFSVVSVGVFLSYVIIVVYKSAVFGPGKITVDRTAGAIAVYLLLGLLWSLAYGMLAATDPEAFTGLEAFTLEQSGAQQDFIYFSFVTLTTLGYGDMSPVSSLAKTLAYFEAVVGQLFLAVTIARLISLEVSQKDSDDAPGES